MVSYHPAKFDGHRQCVSGDIVVGFSLSRDLARPCDQSVLRLHDYELLEHRHHLKFSGHGYCGSGDIMILVCHVIFQDHVIKTSCNFMGRKPSS